MDFYRFCILIILFLPSVCFGESMKIIAVSDDVILDTGYDKIELAGIYIPKELMGKASEFVRNNFTNSEVLPEYGRQKTNRYGNLLAQVHTTRSAWLQGEILSAGLAYVYPTLDNNILLEQMLAAEKTARDKKRGLWVEASNSIITTMPADEILHKYKNKFVIFEGIVTAVKRTKDLIYINFGDDWKTDVTAGIRKENFKNFKNLDIEALEGKKITVRGWVGGYNGPFIEVYCSGQLGIKNLESG
jgi:micrococcal nuclease